MKIIGFEQTITEMFGSKTNYVGMAMVAFGVLQVFKGNLDAGAGFIGMGLGLMGVKDAVVKASR